MGITGFGVRVSGLRVSRDYRVFLEGLGVAGLRGGVSGLGVRV